MTDLQKLTTQLTFTCSHYSHKCVTVADSIDKFHKSGGKVDSQFLNTYLTKIAKTGGYSSCFNNASLTASLIQIFKYLDPTISQMCLLISSHFNTDRYSANQSAWTQKNTELWKAIIEKIKEIPVEVFEAGITAKNYDTLLIICDYTKTTTKCAELLCLHATSKHRFSNVY